MYTSRSSSRYEPIPMLSASISNTYTLFLNLVDHESLSSSTGTQLRHWRGQSSSQELDSSLGGSSSVALPTEKEHTLCWRNFGERGGLRSPRSSHPGDEEVKPVHVSGVQVLRDPSRHLAASYCDGHHRFHQHAAEVIPERHGRHAKRAAEALDPVGGLAVEKLQLPNKMLSWLIDSPGDTLLSRWISVTPAATMASIPMISPIPMRWSSVMPLGLLLQVEDLPTSSNGGLRAGCNLVQLLPFGDFNVEFPVSSYKHLRNARERVTKGLNISIPRGAQKEEEQRHDCRAGRSPKPHSPTPTILKIVEQKVTCKQANLLRNLFKKGMKGPDVVVPDSGDGEDRVSTITTGLTANLRSTLTLYKVTWGPMLCPGSPATRQKIVSRSSTEAKYRVLANAASELVWVQNLLCELGVPVPKAPVLYCDNLGATYVSRNPFFTLVVDVLTKPLGQDMFLCFRSKIGVSDGSSILRGRIGDVSHCLSLQLSFGHSIIVKSTFVGHDLYGSIDGTTKAPTKFADAANTALTP
nr:Retrovirus-related Pol polyprotein from transposon RE1 [Ipomoea batatas]